MIGDINSYLCWWAFYYLIANLIPLKPCLLHFLRKRKHFPLCPILSKIPETCYSQDRRILGSPATQVLRATRTGMDERHILRPTLTLTWRLASSLLSDSTWRKRKLSLGSSSTDMRRSRRDCGPFLSHLSPISLVVWQYHGAHCCHSESQAPLHKLRESLLSFIALGEQDILNHLWSPWSPGGHQTPQQRKINLWCRSSNCVIVHFIVYPFLHTSLLANVHFNDSLS